MKTVGIVADNYKLDKFKKVLTSWGYKNLEIVPFTGDTSTIKISIPEDSRLNEKLKEIKKICQRVELFFKQSN